MGNHTFGRGELDRRHVGRRFRSGLVAHGEGVLPGIYRPIRLPRRLDVHIRQLKDVRVVALECAVVEHAVVEPEERTGREIDGGIQSLKGILFACDGVKQGRLRHREKGSVVRRHVFGFGIRVAKKKSM